MVDYLPGAYYLRQKLRRQFAQHFEGYGYQGIELPIIEEVDLHLRKTGQGVKRWLYRFQDRTERELCLRPEITASVVRALLPQFDQVPLPLRLHYQGPVFRIPDQTTQVGVELIGLGGEMAEAECIEIAFMGLEQLGLTDLELVLSHMGPVMGMVETWIQEERYRDFVVESYSNLGRDLPTVADLAHRLGELGLLPSDSPLPESQRQLAQLLAGLGHGQSRVLLTGLLEMLQVTSDQGPTRDTGEMVERLVTKLDRVNQQVGVRKFIEAVQELARIQGPAQASLEALAQFLDRYQLALAPHQALTNLLGLLTRTNLPRNAIQLDFSFGRTLHYYSGLIFEIRHRGKTLCGGGRYDGLLRSLGNGTDCPTVGFSYHLEHIAAALPTPDPDWQLPGFVHLVLYPQSLNDYGATVQTAHGLRNQGWRVLVHPDFGVIPPQEGVVIHDDQATIYQAHQPITRVPLKDLSTHLLP